MGMFLKWFFLWSPAPYPRRTGGTFVPAAIVYFLRQDYANKELIILDDGSDSVADLIPADPQIRYLRLPSRQTLGTKTQRVHPPQPRRSYHALGRRRLACPASHQVPGRGPAP